MKKRFTHYINNATRAFIKLTMIGGALLLTTQASAHPYGHFGNRMSHCGGYMHMGLWNIGIIALVVIAIVLVMNKVNKN